MVSTPEVSLKCVRKGDLRMLGGLVKRIYVPWRRELRKGEVFRSFSLLGSQKHIGQGKEEEGSVACGSDQAPCFVDPPIERSGCSPAEPYPLEGRFEFKKKRGHRPAENHPWQKGSRKRRKK